MNPIQTDSSSLNPPKKPKKAAVDVIMGREVVKMRYLTSTVDLEKETDIQKQLTATLYALWKEHGLGYCNGNQEGQLRTNSAKIRDTLCFIQKHWGVLLRADFPTIPQETNEGFHECILLNKLTGLSRLGKSCTR